MSLKAFHVVFIACALGLLAFTAYWSGLRATSGADGFMGGLLLASAAGLLAGVPYLGWFLKKSKTL